MQHTRPGLVLVAWLSVATVLAAGGSVVFGGIAARGDAQAARLAPGPASDATEEAPVRATLAPAAKMRAYAPGPAPLRPEARARSWPRLKPSRAPRLAGVAKARPVGGPRLAPSAPVAFAAAEDVTGGAESLFADYAATLFRAREEEGYRQLSLSGGESLARALRGEGVAPKDVDDALWHLADTASVVAAQETGLVQIATRPAQVTPFEVAAGAAPERLERLRVRPEPGLTVTIWREGANWRSRQEAAAVHTRYVTAASVITDSLFAAGARAEVPTEVLARTANLFLYDVDFAREIRRGDRFEVVYEVFHDETGRPLGTGEIVFAAMTWRGGRESRAYYRFEDADGKASYFDAKGESARRLLMKTPIEGARVTSSFGRRRHPTLGYNKQHKGVDFGARAGTPIMAAGDGVVLRADRFGSFGNYVRIRHANGYETAYAHLQGFARGLEKGDRVEQGEVIGYVGSTGRSTGPHLHYEVHRAGDAVNPMALDMAGGVTLGGETLERFAAQAERLDGMRAWPLTVTARASGD